MSSKLENGDPRSHRPQRPWIRTLGIAGAAMMVAAVFSTAVRGDVEERELNANSHRTGPVTAPEDLDRLRRHFRAQNVTDVSDRDVERIYGNLKQELARRYAVSDEANIAGYQSWPRYNRAPYVSAAHGNRYANSYGNAAAKDYGLFEKAGPMPVGSVLAKDTFTVSEDGTVRPGLLFVMEKMPKGFNYVSGDWRYTAILPDGSLLGETKGVSAGRVEFCIACHLAVEHQDHLHFLPAEYRTR